MSEPNAVRGEFEFEIGGRRFVMVPRFQNIARIEAGLGRPLFQAASAGLTVAELAMIIDTLAKPEKPRLSRDDIGDMILDSGGVVAVAPLIERLVNRVVMGGQTDPGGDAGNGNPRASDG